MKCIGIFVSFLRIFQACTSDADCTSGFTSCINNVCECTKSWTLQEVQNLDLASHVDITCNQNNIEVKLDQCVVEATRFQLSDLYLNGVVEAETDISSLDTSGNNDCVGQVQTDNSGPYLTFNINTPLSECNSNIISNGTHHLYQNAVQGWQGNSNAIISRVRKMFLQFECAYPATAEASASFAVNASLTTLQYTLDQEEGTYSASLALFADNTLTTVLLDTDTVFVPDFFYGQISTDSPDLSRFVSKFENCWATPTSDPNDVNQHAFIVNGCPVLSGAAEGTDDVQILISGTGTDISFALRSFTWADDNLGDAVYVHCVASLCDFSQGDCTTAGCSNRKKRSSNNKIPFEVLTVSAHMSRPRSCDDGGNIACGKNASCFDEKEGYTCVCTYGYRKALGSKHHCEPIAVKDSDIIGLF